MTVVRRVDTETVRLTQAELRQAARLMPGTQLREGEWVCACGKIRARSHPGCPGCKERAPR